MEIEFDKNGYLTGYAEPVSVDRFIVNHHFSRSSVNQRELWKRAEEFLDILSSYSLPVMEIWIDGSFISQKAVPNNIDMVVFIRADFLEGNRSSSDSLDNAYKNLDVKWIPVRDKPDEFSLAIDALERMKWFILFSSDRNGLPKGFINLKPS